MTSILTVNARADFGLLAARFAYQMRTDQFGPFIRAHHALLEEELASAGVIYGELGPALVPSTKRQEMALLFNVDLVDDPGYGEAITRMFLPLLGKETTLSVMVGDILLAPAATRELALYSGFVSSPSLAWGQQYIYCVYLNNLAEAQREALHRELCAYPSYLGYVPTTYGSGFRDLAGSLLGTSFIKNKRRIIVDHGGDEPMVSNSNETGLPFEEHGFEIVSVNNILFGPLLSYKIQTEVLPHYREDVLVSLNAISDIPLPLEGFEILIPEAKFGYLTTAKGQILKIAGLDGHSREELASVLRSQLENDYIYRLQHNQDKTVQFTLVLELPREGAHPIKVAVGLKYFPEKQALSLVTLT
ncbi:hypothetical protein AB0N24_23545 [Arthrobacter sp. NPDC093128]|uniref:hypothetical protein n=1 Tax=Arthrobacter sp. NPDC093128 TaxID=3154979 RepID=UPI003448A392